MENFIYKVKVEYILLKKLYTNRFED